MSETNLRNLADFAEILESHSTSGAHVPICALLAEVHRLRACVQTHHDQRGDNRCHFDDLKLYHDALGIGEDPYVCALPPDADMEESCRRYIRQRRCPGAVVPLPGDMTIAQLTAEVERLQKENRHLRDEWNLRYADGGGDYA